MAVYPQAVVDSTPNYLQSKTYSAQFDRKWFSDIASAGVLGSSAFLISFPGGMVVRFAPGVAWVLGANVSDQGMYRVNSPSNADITVQAAHASLPRLDQAIVRVMDNAHDGSTFNEARVEVVPGTPTSGATLTNRNGAANLTTLGEASKNVLLLYDILVPAAASSLSSGNVKRRAFPAIIGGGTFQSDPPLMDVATFQALSDFPDGYEVYVLVDATNGIVWHLRYRAASSSAYKWEFLGGADLRSYVASFGFSAGWVDTGADITLPLSGDYDLRFAAYGVFSTGGVIYAAIALNSTSTPTIAIAQSAFQGTSTIDWRWAGAAAGQVYRVLAQQGGSGATGCSWNSLTALASPVRVGQA